MSPRLRSSTSDGDHDEVITAHGGSDGSGDRRSAERCRVDRSTSRARDSRLAQLRCEGETVTRLWRGGGIGILEDRRQETYDVVEIGLVIDTGDPGLIGGARMREHDGDDEQKDQQHRAQAGGKRGMREAEDKQSRLFRSRTVIGRGGLTMVSK